MKTQQEQESTAEKSSEVSSALTWYCTSSKRERYGSADRGRTGLYILAANKPLVAIDDSKVPLSLTSPLFNTIMRSASWIVLNR